MNVEQVKSAEEAMRLAIDHANQVKGTTYPNPPVGAVIIDQDGRVVGVGGTQPAGGDHAEVVALRRAGGLASGGIAVITLEPCNHYGKTPPCVNALIEARVATVIYAVPDPNAIAGGGAGRLNAAGVQVRTGVLANEVATGPLREWLFKQITGVPHLTWKFATSIDGRSAAADGSSQWISSEAARADLHRRRAIADAIIVGTGTVLADDPALTARLPDGSLADRQPLRVVVGMREIPSEGKGSQRRCAHHGDPDARSPRSAQGAFRPHRCNAGRWAHSGQRLPADRGDQPHPGLRRADSAWRPGYLGSRPGGAQHRAGVALAVRRNRAVWP